MSTNLGMQYLISCYDVRNLVFRIETYHSHLQQYFICVRQSGGVVIGVKIRQHAELHFTWTEQCLTFRNYKLYCNVIKGFCLVISILIFKEEYIITLMYLTFLTNWHIRLPA